MEAFWAALFHYVASFHCGLQDFVANLRCTATISWGLDRWDWGQIYGPLQHLDSFLCCRVLLLWSASLFWSNLSRRWLHIWFRILWYQEEHNNCKVSKSCGCKTNQTHQPSSTVDDSWYWCCADYLCSMHYGQISTLFQKPRGLFR